MAKYRQIHTKIWRDNWFISLSPKERLLFFYLVTNESASIAGIYELSMRVMSFESGLSEDEIITILQRFEADNKVYYADGVVWVVNLRKYHETSSSLVQKKIEKDIESVPDGKIKGIYAQKYGIDRVSIPPYIYSSSSSNSSKNGDGEKYEHHPPEFEAMLSALTKATKTPYGAGFNETEFDSAVYFLIGKDATIEQVSGFLDWWNDKAREAKRAGKDYPYTGKPALKSFLQEWDNYIGEPIAAAADFFEGLVIVDEPRE